MLHDGIFMEEYRMPLRRSKNDNADSDSNSKNIEDEGGNAKKALAGKN
jgi:hypothetical protein